MGYPVKDLKSLEKVEKYYHFGDENKIMYYDLGQIQQSRVQFARTWRSSLTFFKQNKSFRTF